METYFIWASNSESELIYWNILKCPTLIELPAVLAQSLKSKKLKAYVKKGYKIHLSEKLEVDETLAVGGYRQNYFYVLCLHFQFTKTEIYIMSLLLRGIKRDAMLPVMKQEHQWVVERKTIDTHCLNILNKTRTKSDKEAIRVFKA